MPLAEHHRPGAVALVAVPLTNAIRFQRFPRYGGREITRQRIAAAKRALTKQVEDAGLFGGHVAAEQPTLLERVQSIDAGVADFGYAMRMERARKWRELRAWLAALRAEERSKLLTRWRDSDYPGEPLMMRIVLQKWRSDAQ
jgi:hypothetical protein